MSSNFRTFTITQARMGEPLQFQPALGSKELDALVDAYVPGTASKSEKLSTVAVDFFTHATVDFTTGSLSRSYSVAVSPTFNSYNAFAFETSPTQSQSSSFSPPIFTPSPASSMTFADSGYGSISMTPPTRTHGASAGRVAKKPKKETKKAAEARLPGFSIMTKDGVDVTSSAGRGTKTKEQREHAHLMRIMKACDSCKRKKIRCDPSHRRSQTDMSRSATSTTSSSSSSSIRPNPSPPSIPPPPQLPSFGNSAIDDFVLFPEDNAWNADMALPGFDENLDLTHFSFDIGLNDFAPLPNTAIQSFDYSSFDQQATGFLLDRSSGLNQYATGHFDDQLTQGGVSHTRPHHSISSQVSGQIESGWFDGGVQLTESPGTQSTQSQATSSFADNFWPADAANSQIAQQPSLPSADVDWSLLEHGINATSPLGDVSASSSLNRRERRNLPRIERTRNAAIHELVDRVSSAGGSQSPGLAEQLSSGSRSFSNSPTDSWYDHSQSQSPGAADGGSLEYWGLESAPSLVAESMQTLKSAGAAYQPIFEEFQRLQLVLARIKSGDTDRPLVVQQELVSDIEMLTSQLQVLLTRVKNMLRSNRASMQRHSHNSLDPDAHFDHLLGVSPQTLAMQTKHLVSLLCATVNSLQTQQTGTSVTATTNTSVLSSGNMQLAVSPFTPPQPHPQDAGVYVPQGSTSSMSSGSPSYFQDGALGHTVVLQDGKTIILEGENAYQDELPSMSGTISSGNLAIATIAKGNRYRLVSKPVIERLSSLVDGHSDPTILSDIDAVQFSSRPSSEQASPPWDIQLARPRLEISQTQLAYTLAALINVSPDALHSQQTDPSRVQPSQGDISRIAQTASDPAQPNTSTILSEQAQMLRRATLSTQIPLSLSQNVGSSGSEALVQSGSSSPGAIPGTVLEQSTNRIVRQSTTHFGGCVTSLVMLSSLVVLNYIEATSFVLPLAALFLAIPHPSLALVIMATLAVVVAQGFPVSDLMASLRSLVSLALLSAPLMRTSNLVAKGSFRKILSSSKSSLSTSLSPTKDTSLLSMFNELSLGVPAV